MQDKVLALRKKHPRFIFQKLSFEFVSESLVAQLHFLTEPDLAFVTTLRFEHITLEQQQKIDPLLLHEWLLQIGMVEALSYWKASCSPEIVIEAGYVSEDQLAFWQQLLQKGLSEFFFVNQINGWEKDFVQFTVTADKNSCVKDSRDHQNRVIIPVGGGKDSAVTLELLKKAPLPLSTLTVNSNAQIQHLLQLSEVGSHITISRTLDPLILELNKQGYLNGHTPFSAMLAFVSTLAAYIYDYHYVALSNEWSANEGNTIFLGQQINHQYSKTVEFEQHFREYLNQNLSSTIQYFSFLRPLHEIQIAKIFADLEQYLPAFLSCNVGYKTGQWCGNCPKCLFVFIMLSPFIPAAKLEQIFGQNLLDKESLKPIFEELTGMVECKSLECVGTRQETLAALFLTQKMYPQHVPVLLQLAQQKLFPQEAALEQKAMTLLHNFENHHFIPAELKKFAVYSSYEQAT